MTRSSLSEVIGQKGNVAQMLRNSRIGMYVYPVVAPEFTNWRDEQRAWRQSAVLFDQSHHMDEVIVEGPDAAAFLDHVGVNSFTNFDLNRAKHFVPVTPAGHVIGDMIIFREREVPRMLSLSVARADGDTSRPPEIVRYAARSAAEKKARLQSAGE